MEGFPTEISITYASESCGSCLADLLKKTSFMPSMGSAQGKNKGDGRPQDATMIKLIVMK